MCTFVLAGLPKDADVARLRARGWSWIPVDNAALVRATAGRHAWFHASGSVCECETSLGAAHVARAPHGRTKHLPRGAERWSATKRERWHAQREAVAHRDLASTARENASELAVWHASLGEWISLAGEVALVVHDFAGALADPFDVVVEPPRLLRDVAPVELGELAPDHVYVFRA